MSWICISVSLYDCINVSQGIGSALDLYHSITVWMYHCNTGGRKCPGVAWIEGKTQPGSQGCPFLQTGDGFTVSLYCIPALHPCTVSLHFSPALYHGIVFLHCITALHPCQCREVARFKTGMPVLGKLPVFCPFFCDFSRFFVTWSTFNVNSPM